MSYIGGGGEYNKNMNYAPSVPGSNYQYNNAPPINGGNMNYASNYPQQPQNINMNGGGGGGGGCATCGTWCIDHNPFKLANTLGPDIMWAARYKQCMAIGTASAIVAFFGFVLRKDVCGFFNFIAFFHIIPILMPGCHRAMPPFYWSLISIGSIIASVGSFFFGLINGCAAGAGIINAIIIVLELGNLYVLTRMDVDLKNKVKNCCAECGCCGREAQIQTMIPQQESRFVGTQAPNAMNTPTQQGTMTRNVNVNNGLGSLNGYETGPTGWNNNGLTGGGGGTSNDAASYYNNNAQNSNHYTNASYGNHYQTGMSNPNVQQMKEIKRKSQGSYASGAGNSHYLQYQPEKAPTQAPLQMTSNYRPAFLSDTASEISNGTMRSGKPQPPAPPSPPPMLPQSPKPMSVASMPMPKRITPPPQSYTSYGTGTNYKAPFPQPPPTGRNQYTSSDDDEEEHEHGVVPEYGGEIKFQQNQNTLVKGKRTSNASNKNKSKNLNPVAANQVKNWKRNQNPTMQEQDTGDDEVEFEGMSDLGMDSASRISTKSGEKEKAGSLIINSTILYENGGGNTLRNDKRRFSPTV